jgi:hypothetical protein
MYIAMAMRYLRDSSLPRSGQIKLVATIDLKDEILKRLKLFFNVGDRARVILRSLSSDFYQL